MGSVARFLMHMRDNAYSEKLLTVNYGLVESNYHALLGVMDHERYPMEADWVHACIPLFPSRTAQADSIEGGCMILDVILSLNLVQQPFLRHQYADLFIRLLRL